MRFGRGACPDGYLPVFSVDTEEQAHQVIVGTCSRGLDGEYYSHDLAREQTLENLIKLGDKMERVYDLIVESARRARPQERGAEQ